MARAMLVLAIVLAALLPPRGEAGADDAPWTQWIDSQCSMARHDWLAVAKSNPGFGWSLSPGARPGASFAEAVARLDMLRLSEAQGDTAAMPSFRQHCCKVRIWENTQTGETVIVKENDIGGFGFRESSLSRPGMCCEDAAFAIGADPMSCTAVPLMSIPGAVVAMTPQGPLAMGGPLTIPSDPPLVVAALAAPPTPRAAGYVGCFKDPNNPFDLDGYLERSRENTPQRCVEICRSRGFAYAGVQYGESCLCGNRYGQFGTADNCSMACTGDGGQTCGGINSNSVYATGL